MKIDKNTIDRICALPDDKLWGTVRLFASSAGVTVPPRPSSPHEVARLRRTLSELTEADISRAGELIKRFKGKM